MSLFYSRHEIAVVAEYVPVKSLEGRVAAGQQMHAACM
jgi:hypothetical protein